MWKTCTSLTDMIGLLCGTSGVCFSLGRLNGPLLLLLLTSDSCLFFVFSQCKDNVHPTRILYAARSEVLIAASGPLVLDFPLDWINISPGGMPAIKDTSGSLLAGACLAKVAALLVRSSREQRASVVTRERVFLQWFERPRVSACPAF